MPPICTSSEVNILVYHYLKESGFNHSCFALRHESRLDDDPLSREAGIEPGFLVKVLQKGCLYMAVEAHVREDGTEKPCTAPFRLVGPPHVCDDNPRPPTPPPPRRLTPSPPRRPRQNGSMHPPGRSAANGTTSASASGSRSNSRRPSGEEVNSVVEGVRRTSADNGDGDGDVEMGDAGPSAGPSKLLTKRKGDVPSREDKRRRRQTPRERDRDSVPSTAPTEDGLDDDASASRAVAKVGKADHSGQPFSTEAHMGKSAKAREKERDRDREAASRKSRDDKGKKVNADQAKEESTAGDDDQGSVGEDEEEAGLAGVTGKTKSGKQRASPLTSLPSSRSKKPASHHKKQPSGSAPSSQSGAANSSLSSSTFTRGERPKKAGPDAVAADEAEGIRGCGAPQISKDDAVWLTGHTGSVLIGAWNSTVPGMLATGSADTTVRVWNVPAHKRKDMDEPAVLRHMPAASSKEVTALDWNPAGSLLATGSYDGIVRIWTPEGDLVYVLSMHQGTINGLRWNRQGNMLLSCSGDSAAIVWDASDGRLKNQFNIHKGPVLDVDWLVSVDGNPPQSSISDEDQIFATCSEDHVVHLCRVGSKMPVRTFKGHTDEVNAIRFDLTRTLLASVSDDATIKIWNIDSLGLAGGSGEKGVRRRELGKLRASAGPEGAGVGSEDEEEDGMAELEGRGRFCKRTLTGHQGPIQRCYWAPSGPGSANPSGPRILATTSHDSTARIWNVDEGTCLHVITAHTDTVFSLSFSPDARFICSGGWDKSAYITRLEDGAVVKEFHGGDGVYEVLWHAQPTSSASAPPNGTSADGDVEINEETKGKALVRPPPSAPPRWRQHRIAVCMHNKLVAVIDPLPLEGLESEGSSAPAPTAPVKR